MLFTRFRKFSVAKRLFYVLVDANIIEIYLLVVRFEILDDSRIVCSSAAIFIRHFY